MKSLIIINTQEWLRQKFFQIVFFIAFVYMGLSSLFGSLSFIEQKRITVDLGLAGLELIAVFLAAFISTHALARDIDRRTIQLVLARPIARWHILVGYLGSIGALNLILSVFLGLTLLVIASLYDSVTSLIVALMTIILKSLVVAAFGLLISVKVRPMLSLVMTLGFWVLAYSVPDFGFFAEKLKNETLIFIHEILKYVIPRFYLFNWKDIHFFEGTVGDGSVLWSWFHCLGWTFLLLFLAATLFRKKEIV